MKVTFITTIKHNVGDDFVRDGLTFLFMRAIGDVTIQCVHKHVPLTVRPELEWFYSAGFSAMLDNIHERMGLRISHLLDLVPINPKSDKILSSDLLVQSGAPAYWIYPDGNGCHTNEWYGPLIEKRYAQIAKRVPFLNLGVGSCLPASSDGREVLDNPACAAYVRRLFEIAQVTTVRDKVAHRILKGLGLDAPLLPCPSLFARDFHGLEPAKPEYVVLNFMQYGGHRFFSEQVDVHRWVASIQNFYAAVKSMFPIVVSCHHHQEAKWIMGILPEAKIFIGKNAKEYLTFYSKAKFFIGCRVHAAYAVTSFGRPSFVIGTDTRTHMMDEVHLKKAFVSEVTKELLCHIYEELDNKCDDYFNKFSEIRLNAMRGYEHVLEGPLRYVNHRKDHNRGKL